nr:MAG: hypothetical protein A2V48_02535 [Candidatus Amesbacteria bacterium RBG_19FT_COMBO_48_16]
MKKLVPWLILGFGLRLILIPITLHPDIRAVYLAADLINHRGQMFDFYDYLSRLPRDDKLIISFGYDNIFIFIYPPLAYLTHALFNLFLSPLYPASAFQTLIYDIGRARLDSGLPLLLYLLKLPYLLADIFCFWLIYRLLPDKNKILGSLVWIFNPLVIYSAYMMGQFDIFIAAFLLLAVYFADKKPLLAAVTLGIGAGFKPFPLLLLFFLPGSKIKNIISGLAAYLVILLPYLPSWGFRHYALFAAQSEKMFYAGIPVSGSQLLPLFAVVYSVFAWWNHFRPRDLPLWGWFLAVLLLFFSVTHFHPQWFTWATPLLTMSFALLPKTRLPLLALLAGFIMIIFSFDQSLSFGLFGSNLRLLLPDDFISIVRGLFAGTAAVTVWQILRHESVPA